MGSFWSTEPPAHASESEVSSTGNPAGDPAQPPTTVVDSTRSSSSGGPVQPPTTVLQSTITFTRDSMSDSEECCLERSTGYEASSIGRVKTENTMKRKNSINATASSRSPSSSSHSNTIIDLTTNDSDDEITADTSQAKRQKIEEKRKTPWINHASGKTLDRISRALSQRMYLINQQDDSTADNLSRTYAVLGSTGNVYNVKIDSSPSCTCPDSFPCCKHILFVFLRVLKLPRQSPFIYQNSLLQSDLRHIFTHSVTTNPSDVLAKQAVIEAFKRKTEDGAEESEAERRRLPDWEPGAECPICFEDLVEAKKDDMVACATCCKYIHTDCISAWEVACKKPTTCPLCRQIWRRYGESEVSARAEAGEGYVNLAAEQGLPHYRVGFRRRYF